MTYNLKILDIPGVQAILHCKGDKPSLQRCALPVVVEIMRLHIRAPHAKVTWLAPWGMQEAVLLAVLAGGMALVVLSFCGGILLDIVDALYVCYATDRSVPTRSLSDWPPDRFASGFLLDIVDALYVCYATDRSILTHSTSERPFHWLAVGW